ncbi:MAG TPA: hypothetical protein VE130_08935 [Nitrososphaeraceae archaeon]|nr:hypothetical protein [Nitrososphaeraceae archaeon]
MAITSRHHKEDEEQAAADVLDKENTNARTKTNDEPLADTREEKKQKVYHITAANLALDTKDAYESVSCWYL